MNYRISKRANADIEAICDYIAENNPDAADQFEDRIHTRPDVKDKRYLFRAVGNYIVAYRLEQNELVVVRVVHGARDFRKLFKSDPK